jgi:hypothetical protein
LQHSGGQPSQLYKFEERLVSLDAQGGVVSCGEHGIRISSGLTLYSIRIDTIALPAGAAIGSLLRVHFTMERGVNMPPTVVSASVVAQTVDLEVFMISGSPVTSLPEVPVETTVGEILHMVYPGGRGKLLRQDRVLAPRLTLREAGILQNDTLTLVQEGSEASSDPSSGQSSSDLSDPRDRHSSANGINDFHMVYEDTD